MATMTHAQRGWALCAKLAESTNMDIKQIEDLFTLIRTEYPFRKPQVAKKRADMTAEELAAARLKDVERKKKRYAEDEEYRARIRAANNKWNKKQRASIHNLCIENEKV